MKIKELLDKASAGYEDGLEEFYDKDGEFDRRNHGDTLGDFIVLELIETFDSSFTDEEQLDEARRVIENAIRELQGVLSEM